MRSGPVEFIEMVRAVRDARQITTSEARVLCQEWRAKYREQVASEARAVEMHERDAAIVAHAREMLMTAVTQPHIGVDARDVVKIVLNAAREFQAVVDEEFKS